MRGDDRREHILQAATRIFAKHGYQEASIDLVCKEAGIARGTLYQYFDDKRGLFREILQAYTERIRAFMQPFDTEGLELPSDPESLAALLSMRLHIIFQTVQEHRELYTIFFQEAQAKTTGTEDLVREVDAQFLSLMRQEILLVSAKGILKVDNAEFTANFILGGVLKTAQQYILESATPVDVQALAQQCAKLIIRMLTANTIE